MKLFTFTIEYAGERWNKYLEQTFGKELAEQMQAESHQTAKHHFCKVSIPDYKSDKVLEEKIRNMENVSSAYIADDKKTLVVK